ncbi:peroxiredoxin family protein [Jeotgalibacillus soli]|uniref:Peroxiredoxin n=1 Tax=Jeotgalibacillus soli TaxID=889306 RepID=A0A0C2RGA1_9BACL|nr:TlpA disulfide reductase family protein [Jeotgalibacillus soli]KIL49230.1 peroxiredoxin [Jeotgalibacillus soli]
MIKRILALVLVGALVSILIVNVINDQKERQAEQARQQQYSVAPAENSRAQEAPPSNGGILEEGQLAPDFQTTTLDGEEVSLSDYRGKKIILNFWATWCPPCIAEMPHMQNYYEEEAKDQNVEILAVNLTSMDHGIDKVKQFTEDFELTFPVLMDESGSIGDQFQVFTIPTTYMLDEEGVIIRKLLGPMDQEMMSSMMNE